MPPCQRFQQEDNPKGSQRGPETTIRLLIGCHTFLYAQGVKRLLAGDRGIEVVGIATNGKALEKMCRRRPDVVLADSGMGRRLLDKGSDGARVLLVSDGRFPAAHRGLQDLVDRGLAGILPACADAETVGRAVRAVCKGDLWMDCELLKASLLVEDGDGRDVHLTPRETEILHHLRAGRTNKEIARKLFVSEQAVKVHFNHLYKKFGVSNRVKLALHAHELLADHLGDS